MDKGDFGLNILVTGGTGYIGSHTCVALLKAGHSVIIVDNLINSAQKTIDHIRKLVGKEANMTFYKADVADKKAMEPLFASQALDGIIHFAGLKAVGESVKIPLEYYMNNLKSTMNLIDLSLQYGVNRFVFSSSATVYGDNESPLLESMPLRTTTNPYGETKAMCERILTDVAHANPQFAITLLRYFNPVGAHESGLIGESPNGVPNNLMPFITQVAAGKLQQLQVFGNDYPTRDGTGVRDYIHVMDLAEGHVTAFEQSKPGVQIYNLGTGAGTSVLELIHAFEEVNNVKVAYKIVERRPGDVATCYADVSKAAKSSIGKPNAIFMICVVMRGASSK